MEKDKKINGFGLFGIIIFAAVIASVAFGGGLYWSETKKQQSLFEIGADAIKRAEELKKQIESRGEQIYRSPTSIDSSIDSDIDTSEWKTYRNEKYGFEAKYPPEVDFSEMDERDGLSSVFSAYVGTDSQGTVTYDTLFMKVKQNSEIRTLEEFKESIVESDLKWCRQFKLSCPKPVYSTSTIGGYPFFRAAFPDDEIYGGLIKGNTFFNFHGTTFGNGFNVDQLVSTLKFIK